VDLATVSPRRGHSSVRTTANVCSHAIGPGPRLTDTRYTDRFNRCDASLKPLPLPENVWPNKGGVTPDPPVFCGRRGKAQPLVN